MMSGSQVKKASIAACVVFLGGALIVAAAATIKGAYKVETESELDIPATPVCKTQNESETERTPVCQTQNVSETGGTSVDAATPQSYRDFSLVLTYIDKGLGDFYWTLNIYRAVLDARRDSPACVVAYLNADIDIGNVRGEHTYLKFRDAASVHDVVLEHGVFYVLQGESADRAAFDRINVLARAVSVCICFDTCSHFFSSVDAAKVFEYDYAHTAILFRDYSSIPLERAYRKTRLSPKEYRGTLAEDAQTRFDAAKVASLVPDSEYVFCYFYSSPFSLPEPVLSLVTLVSDVMRLDGRCEETVTVLSNFELSKMLQWRTWLDDASESMEERAEKVRQRLWSADIDFERGTMRVGEGGPVFRFVSYGHVSEPEFEYMLLRSGEVAGCTGDMSVSQVLSTGRLMAYQCLSHKVKFFERLVEIWKEVNGNNHLRMLCAETGDVEFRRWGLPPRLDIRSFREQYGVFLAHLRKNDFRTALQSMIRERLEN